MMFLQFAFTRTDVARAFIIVEIQHQKCGESQCLFHLLFFFLHTSLVYQLDFCGIKKKKNKKSKLALESYLHHIHISLGLYLLLTTRVWSVRETSAAHILHIRFTLTLHFSTAHMVSYHNCSKTRAFLSHRTFPSELLHVNMSFDK